MITKILKVFFCGMVQLFARYISCSRGKPLTGVDYLVCLGQTISRIGIVDFKLKRILGSIRLAKFITAIGTLQQFVVWRRIFNQKQ